MDAVLSRQQLDRVCVVLVRARNPNNIGAVARAMHDFGFHHLRVVNDYAVPFETARSAVDASAVLAGATAFDNVVQAIGERTLQHPVHALPEAATEIAAELEREDGAGRVALLFGSEKTGLSNEELSHCNWLLTIPMQQHEDIRHPSMNLGQAVAVCLYELVRQRAVHVAPSVAAGAKAAEVERLTMLLHEVLQKTEYTRHHPANSDESQIRRMALRMGLASSDVPVWMGILRQILWKVRGTGVGED
jgi:tRNA/rRNA methyltransferase